MLNRLLRTFYNYLMTLSSIIFLFFVLYKHFLICYTYKKKKKGELGKLMINERIRILRKNELKMTQQDFANKIEISRSNLGNIETGEVTVTDRTISSICRVFNVNEKWLRTGEGEMFNKVSKELEISKFANEILCDENDSFRKKVVKLLAKMDEKDWTYLENLAKKLLEEKD